MSERRSALRTAFIWVGVCVLLLIIAHTALVRATQSRVDAEIAYIRARGEAEWAALAAATAKLQLVEALIEEAQRRPKCRFKVDWEKGDIPQPYYLRRASAGLAAGAVVNARAGNMGESVRLVELALRLDNAIMGIPSLPAALTAYSTCCRTLRGLRLCLAHRSLTEPQCARLRRVVPSIEPRAAFVRADPFVNLVSCTRPVKDKMLANLALAEALLAIEAYRDRRGSYPVSLKQAASELGWKLRQDPFSGKLPVYRRTKGGFVLYCLGQDMDDDHGLDPEANNLYPSRDGDIVWEWDAGKGWVAPYEAPKPTPGGVPPPGPM